MCNVYIITIPFLPINVSPCLKTLRFNVKSHKFVSACFLWMNSKAASLVFASGIFWPVSWLRWLLTTSVSKRNVRAVRISLATNTCIFLGSVHTNRFQSSPVRLTKTRQWLFSLLSMAAAAVRTHYITELHSIITKWKVNLWYKFSERGRRHRPRRVSSLMLAYRWQCSRCQFSALTCISVY
jgi:hypothetical protein